MLDECKGEKFYEILALFSAAVLKKVLAARGANHRNAAVARKLATAPTLSNDAQRSLLPLAIAHKAALVNVLRRKEEKRRKFAEFEATLDTKANDINKRIRTCMDTPRAKRPAVQQRDADAIKRQLADNWIGNQKWLGIMLHGDQVQAGDAFLSNRFDKVWTMVERGRKLEDAAPEAGLLEDLQSRVQEQQSRLQKWRNFHDELRKDNAQASTTTQRAPTAIKDIRFDNHIQHQLPSAKQVEGGVVQRSALRTAYVDVLSDMDAELLRVSQAKPQKASTFFQRRRRSSASAPRSPIRTRTISKSGTTPKGPPSSAWHPEPKTLVQEPKTLVSEQKALFEGLSVSNRTNGPIRRTPSKKETSIYSDSTLVGQLSSLQIAAPHAQTATSPRRQRFQQEPEPEPTPTPDVRAASSSPLASEGSPVPSQPTPYSEPSPMESPTPAFERSIPTLEAPNLNPEEALADQIITSIGNATPSPVKKPQPRMSMSLVERTRMTLSRTPSFEPVPESPDDLPLAPPTVLPPVANAELDNVATLLERTRLSMAAMSSRPRASLALSQETAKKQKRKSRSSLFPVNQFDTPRTRKSFEAIEAAKSSEKTPKEDLLSGDIDYDRVFRSRPRIATSPIFSPEKHPMSYGEDLDEDAYDEEITGIDLGDVDQSDDEDDDGFTQTWANSPSRRAAKVDY
jgi:hypothetical protein